MNEASNQVQQLVEGSNKFASGMEELAQGNTKIYNEVNPILEVVREKLAQIKDTNFKEEFDSITNKEDYLNAYNDAKAKLAENPDDEALKIYIALFDHIIEIANKYDIEKEYKKICELDDGIDAQHKEIQELNNKYKNELNPAIEKLPSLLSKLTELKTALNTLVNSYATLDSGINSYTGAYEQIVKGYQTLYSGIGDLEKGVESLNTGTKTLYDGTVSLEDGAEELNDGTSEMRDKTKNIDTEIDDKINNMLDEFKNTDYKPESFASSENGEINAVQFVMKTKGIEINNEVQEEVKEEHLNFFQKIIRLFFKK